MKLDSKYFELLACQVHGRGACEDGRAGLPVEGLPGGGLYKAPVGRGQEGKYYLFCLEHVRQFNAAYNYFEGWSTAQVEAFQKDAVIGHRPTWKTGTAGEVPGARPRCGPEGAFGEGFADPHDFLKSRLRRDTAPPARRAKPLERKSLDALGLPEGADRVQIKARFKELVKLHHPDANGGDKRSENKLREIIQAYNYLKQAGLV